MTPTEYRMHPLPDMNLTYHAMQKMEDIHRIPLSERLLHSN
ncbi:hypothetical protein [Serratia oryzae]|nr:hypothetical protein [Serratia oryzae]